MSGNRLLQIIFLFISSSIFFYKKLKIDKFLITVIFFILLIISVQYIQFKFISYNTTLGTFVRFLVPYFFIKIIGKNYLTYYVNLLYVFSILSLLLYLPSMIFPNFFQFLLNISSNTGIQTLQEENNLIIYTVETGTRLGILRNSGLFWEPGAYSGFLIMAVLINIVKTDSLWNHKNLIFFITILSTFSTSGYIALFLTIIFYYITNIKRRVAYYFLIPLLCLSAWSAFYKIDFLSNRINNEINKTKNNKLEYSGRIGSGKKDLEDILKFPFFGRGRNVETRFENYNVRDFLKFHRTNGVTDFAVKYGLLFCVFYFLNIYKSFSAFCFESGFNKRFAFLMLVLVFTIGFSQIYFQGVFFISLIYLHVIYKVPSLVMR